MSKRIHIIPVGHPEPLHSASLNCWCHPADRDEGTIAIHNAKDGREKWERQGIIDSDKRWALVYEEVESKWNPTDSMYKQDELSEAYAWAENEAMRRGPEDVKHLRVLAGAVKRLEWLLKRGVAWRGCYDNAWQEGEWLYAHQNAIAEIDDAMRKDNQ